MTYINSDAETPVTSPRRFQVTVDEPFSAGWCRLTLENPR